MHSWKERERERERFISAGCVLFYNAKCMSNERRRKRERE